MAKRSKCIETMNFSKIILTGFLILSSLILFGQETNIDSVVHDLNTLNEIEFFKKYSFYEKTTTKEELEITKFIWSTDHLRSIDKSFRSDGIKTVTMIDGRPSKESKYYIIGHYHLPTSDHLARLSYYRIDLKAKTIEYQNLDDFTKDKWKEIE